MLNIEVEKMNCVLKNVNPRPESRGKDGSALGVDLKIETELPVSFMNSLTLPSTESGIDYASTFYDDEGMPKATGFAFVTFDREYEDQIVTIWIGRQKRVWDERTLVKGITAQFITGHMLKVRMTIQIHPSADDSGWLNGGLLKKTIAFQLDPQQQMDIEDSE